MKLLVKICFLWTVFFWFFSKANAQYLKENNYYDLTFSTSGSQSVAALNWSHLHRIGKNNKFSIGYGVRFNSSFGKNTDFITAPAELTSGKTGVGVIFSETILENLDTISMDKYLVNSLNLAIHLNYQLNPKLMIEFNIDALGLSFGPEQMAKYNSSKRSDSPNKEIDQTAKPTSYNVLLTSENDIGSLNSEILLKYWFSPKWALKAGATFIFTEYTTNNVLYANNDRFRNKSLQGMIGISYSPFRK
jgi:hypothetical protein